ncbi:LlaMI family restriction endonuclease [Veillonella criceti]|uniref:LlaMI restriction endonuclease n=1 Tax=Veillonella criceti TaxID=103891 RepID=A0A380NL38_9FIRM|nr:LlaMI family restriction endonuclease [Veillonella criceti]SUP42849.1 LlaMI restriction endonuclease [Veillonella criceti]
MDPNKEMLINFFRAYVKGQVPDVTGRNERHDGKEGNWLEEQFGKSPDADNHADFYGYELKNETTSKTSFGDWSANRYIYKKSCYSHLFDGKTPTQRQDSFCRIFGAPNPDKNNRYSWSGRPVPKINKYNSFGQILKIVEPNESWGTPFDTPIREFDILAVYSFSKDMRENKDFIIPKPLQQENLIIAHWFGLESLSIKRGDKCLKQKLEDKFNDMGWFTCKTDLNGKYDRICFGAPFNYNSWLELIRRGIVFFDSGMHEGNIRPYSQWRASNQFWDSLIIETYK